MHLLRFVAAAALPLLCNLPARGASTVTSYTEVRKAFQDAYAHVSTSMEESGSSDSESLKNYPLYPYLQAARIQQALTGTDTEALAQADKLAADFMVAYGQQPVARILRRTWLDSLARREQWNQFLAVYRDAGASDTARCQSFVARIEIGKTEGLAADIAKEWLTPHSLPECDRPFAWLKQNGVLTTALIEERVHLALDNNNPAFARQIIDQLPADRAAPLFQWAGLLREFAARASTPMIAFFLKRPETPVDRTALLAGWKRLTRGDREAAQERYPKLVSARGLDHDSASAFALALALGLAWDREPAALQYFELVAPIDLDDSSREWWARAALWSKDWKLAARVIGSMSETNRQSARWRYWLARTTEASQDLQSATPLYESVLADDNYYSAMAAARLNRPLTPHPEALPADSHTLAALEHQPALERAHELLLCGMRPEAQVEWIYGYDSLSPEARVQSIRLAAEWGWYDQAVTVPQALFRTSTGDYSLLYHATLRYGGRTRPLIWRRSLQRSSTEWCARRVCIASMRSRTPEPAASCSWSPPPPAALRVTTSDRHRR